MKQKITFLFLFAIMAIATGLSTSSAMTPAKLSNKEKAYEVLKLKCNTCHLKDKPNYFFTLKNMNRFAKKIRKQVFIKKKMPKGDEHNLTVKERLVLKTWVDAQLGRK